MKTQHIGQVFTIYQAFLNYSANLTVAHHLNIKQKTHLSWGSLLIDEKDFFMSATQLAHISISKINMLILSKRAVQKSC